MNRLLLAAMAASTLLSVSHAQASDFEAALTSETAQITLRSDSSVIGWGGSELAVGLFYNEADDVLGQVGLFQRRQPSKEMPLTLGVGARAYVGAMDAVDSNVAALAIGAEARYTIPGKMPMAVYLTGHYAPKITSFGDSEELTDVNLGFQLEILPQTTAFAGYRNLKIGTEKHPEKIDLDDDRVHVGIRLTF